MTDPRPSENTDPIQLPGMRAAGFFDDLPTLGKDFFMETANDEQDPIEDLIEQAENAHDHTLGLVFAQLATVRAVQAQTEQIRIANIITWTTANGFAPSNEAQDQIVKGLGL